MRKCSEYKNLVLVSLILVFQTAVKFFPWGQQILNFPSLMFILAWSIGKKMECMYWLEDPSCTSNISVPWKTLRHNGMISGLWGKEIWVWDLLRSLCCILPWATPQYPPPPLPRSVNGYCGTVKWAWCRGRGKYLPWNSITFRGRWNTPSCVSCNRNYDKLRLRDTLPPPPPPQHKLSSFLYLPWRNQK